MYHLYQHTHTVPFKIFIRKDSNSYIDPKFSNSSNIITTPSPFQFHKLPPACLFAPFIRRSNVDHYLADTRQLSHLHQFMAAIKLPVGGGMNDTAGLHISTNHSAGSSHPNSSSCCCVSVRMELTKASSCVVQY